MISHFVACFVIRTSHINEIHPVDSNHKNNLASSHLKLHKMRNEMAGVQC